ncbi:MAG TPA: invasion associated locus B family protein [Xanthobacteraceae bacterium]
MELRIAFGPARSLRWAVTTIAATGFVLGGAVWATAQQQPAPAAAPTQTAPAKPAAAKPQPKKPATPAPAAQAAPAQAAPPVQQAQAAAPAQQLPLVYSPWTKICGKDQQPNSKEVCLVIKEARLETGQFVAGAVLVEPEGDPKKMLRVTLPLGMQLQQGTRVIIDQGNPVARPYVICFPNGCMSDYDADLDMVGKLKKGQGLIVQAINAGGQPISLTLPLADFAKAYDGPPTDPKVLEEQQKKLQEELQKKAEEARKKLESQQPQAAAPGAVPAGK